MTELYLQYYRREDPFLAEKIAEQVISEFIAPFCLACGGNGETMFNELKQSCAYCEGSGLRRYTDEERSRLMGISWARVKIVRHKMQWAYDYIATQDRIVNEVMAKELER